MSDYNIPPNFSHEDLTRLLESLPPSQRLEYLNALSTPVTSHELGVLGSSGGSGGSGGMGGIFGLGPRNGPKTNKKAKFVKFHPEDDKNLYPDNIFERITDPDTFEHVIDHLGRIKWWGIEKVHPAGHKHESAVDHGDSMEHFLARKSSGILYLNGFKNKGRIIKGTPEEQFVARLVNLQTAKLQKMDLGDLTERDYTLRIELRMPHTFKKVSNVDVWREFKVSGGLSIAALADKVITPLMGWVRNYHAHAFTVFKDGAVYGPTECNSIDMVHTQSMGYAMVPERSNRGTWTLAHLLQEEGEEMGWLYDWGDLWTHVIKVLFIAPASSSTSKVEILSGHGACPPEDDGNMDIWVDEVHSLRTGNREAKRDVLQKISNSLNYKVVLPVSEISLDAGGRRNMRAGSREEVVIPLTSFDPDKFDVEEARKRVKAALGSPDSVHSGPKIFVQPLLHDLNFDDEDQDGVPIVRGMPGTMDPNGLKKGQRLEKTFTRDELVGNCTLPRPYMQEVTSGKRDKIAGGCCWSCGSPHGLHGCARCQKTLYCSKECQREHWKGGHKLVCGK